VIGLLFFCFLVVVVVVIKIKMFVDLQKLKFIEDFATKVAKLFVSRSTTPTQCDGFVCECERQRERERERERERDGVGFVVGLM
jgi:hypothetical protein